jgi:cytochrome b subunit of formate dehydrogenase
MVMLEDTNKEIWRKKHHGKWHGDKKYKRDYDDYDDHDWDHDDD